MRGFVTLVRRELRDAMPSVVGFAALVLVLVVGIVSLTELTSGAHDVVSRLTFLCWTSTTVFAAFVTADLVGGDISSRRIELLALLPVAPGSVWRAKLASVLVAVVVMAAFAVGVSAVAIALRAWGSPVESFLDGLLTKWRPTALAISFAISSTMLLGNLRLRGLAAVCAAAITLGLLVQVTRWGADIRARSPASELTDSTLQGIVAAAALAGSAAGFIWGRVHVGVLRPAVIGGSVTLAVLGIPLAAASAYARPVAPDEPRVHVSRLFVQPGGRLAVMEFMDDGAKDRHLIRPWVLTIPEGEFRPLPADRIALRPDGSGQVWADDGTLWVVTADDETLTRVEPASGRPVGPALSRSEATRLRGMSPPQATEPRIEPRQAAAGDDMVPYAVTTPSIDGPANVVRSCLPPRLLDATSVLFAPARRQLAVRWLDSGRERVIALSKTDFHSSDIGSVTPDGACVIVRLAGEWTAIDVATGRTTAIGASESAPKWVPVVGDSRRRIVQISRPEGHPNALLDVVTGRRSDFDQVYPGIFYAVADGLLLHHTGSRLELYDAELKMTKQLWRRVEDRR